MLTQTQVIDAKNNWESNLREKTTAKNKNAYVANRVVLLLDDILDIIKGVWKSTTFKPRRKDSNTVEQLYLDSKGDIPLAFQLHLLACQAFASERGIDIRSDIDFGDNGEVTINWEIISVSGEGIKFMDSHRSTFMQWTTDKKISEDEEIDIKVDTEDEEKQE